MLSGLDVSHWEGKVNWAQVCQAGYRFAFTKATEGISYVDDTFLANISGAQAAGIPIGAYHFFHLTLPAKAQAEFYLSKIQKVKLELPPVLDFEENTALSKPQAAAAIKTWLDMVEAATRRKPIIYTGLYYWEGSLGSPDWANNYPLWIAQYTPGPQPTVPHSWTRWTFWQYTDKGSVPGIQGGVDLNYTSLDEAGLQALCHPGEKEQGEPEKHAEGQTAEPGSLEERIARLEQQLQDLAELFKQKKVL